MVSRPKRPRPPSRIPSILLTLCLFPYLTPVHTPFDIQPYALLVGTVLCAGAFLEKSVGGIPTPALLPLVLLGIAAASAGANGLSMDSIRSLAGYSSVAFISIAVFFYADIINMRLITWASAIWMIVGAVQRLAYPAFMTGFTSRSSTSASRGVTSLAAEPSFYGVIAICFLLLAQYAYLQKNISRREFVATFACGIANLALAASALALVIFAAYIACYLLLNTDIIKIASRSLTTAAVAGATVLLIRATGTFTNTRAYDLLSLGDTPLRSKLLSDQSVAQRMFSIQATVESAWYSRGLGYGVGTWSSGLNDLLMKSSSLQEYPDGSVVVGRIMSGFGSALYELGVVGLILPLAMLITIAGIRRHASREVLSWAGVSCATMTLIMVSAIPLTFPLFPVLLGILCRESVGAELSMNVRATAHGKRRNETPTPFTRSR